MTQDQIAGLPEGHYVKSVQWCNNGGWVAIVERIPRKRVVVAEFVVPKGACIGIYPKITAEFHMQDNSMKVVSDCLMSIREFDE